jgi:alpha-L-fucosidase 2
LQGLWNDLLTPPWGSKFTTNINLEMNYWPAEPLNLIRLLANHFLVIVDDLGKTGKPPLREHYGAPGWVLHHNTDIWRGTAPVNASNHGIWVSGAPGFVTSYGSIIYIQKMINFLRSRAYPEMKGAAKFLCIFGERPQNGLPNQHTIQLAGAWRIGCRANYGSPDHPRPV